jgi:hypothetical protein
MGLDYFIMAFVGAVGVLQMAASRSSLRGVLFFQSRRLSGVLGGLALVGAFLWFYISEPRNLPDTNGGLSGNEDAWLFCAASTLAILFTFAVTSVVNRKMGRDTNCPPGICALRHTTFYTAFKRAVRKLWTLF